MMQSMIYALAIGILTVILSACGAGSPSSDVVPDNTPTSTLDTSSEMPGSGVIVQPARATSSQGYFQEALYSAALEELGFEVLDFIEMDTELFYAAVAEGSVDYWANGWFPLHTQYEDSYSSGASIAGTVAAFGGLQGYQVDKAGADEFNITSLQDFEREEVKKAYDIDGNGKADLVACPEGWGCDFVIEYHLDTFDLRDHIDERNGPYDERMKAAVDRFKNGEHVFFYTWSPNWTLAQIEPGKDSVWIEVPYPAHPAGHGAEVLTLGGIKGCVNDPCLMGFPGNDLKVIANDEFLSNNPAAAKLFEVMAIPLDDILRQNNRMNNGENTDAEIDAHAQEWVALNRELLDSWLAQARRATR